MHIIELLSMNLTNQGYATISALSGEEGIVLARTELPDLIILDLMLEGIDGIETCRRLKSDPVLENIPIIMVTAKSEETDKVIGLGMGADDYITKPFGLRELFARIAAILRRVDKHNPNDRILRINDLVIDTMKHQVTCSGESINLTLTEFRLLQMLVLNCGTIVTRETILSDIIGRDKSNDDGIIDVHIRNLRKKMIVPTLETVTIVTVRGVGYKIAL